MKFKDLKFEPAHNNGTQARHTFDNGYAVSVIKSDMSYGGDQGLYELALFGHDGQLDYTTTITDDVVGNLTEDDVTDYLGRVEALDPDPEKNLGDVGDTHDFGDMMGSLRLDLW